MKRIRPIHACIVAVIAMALPLGPLAAQESDEVPWYEQESEPMVATPDEDPESEASSSGGAAPVTAEPEPDEDGTSPEDGLVELPVEPEAAEPATEPARRDATVLDTIEVTASKRIKSQRDLPGSVGAVRGDDLEKMSAQGMSDFLKLVPGVTLTEFAADRQVVVIRGIASNTGAPGTQFTSQTTGIFLEDMPFNDLFLPLSTPNVNPFDLERVEVLKGPQGTLFGSGALAGAVRYVVQKPNLGIWQGKASTTLTQTKHSEGLSRIGAGALNIPLGNDVALRAVGLYRDDAGLYDSLPNGGNTRDEEDIDRLTQTTGRIMGRWDATEDLKVSAFHFRQKTNQDDNAAANHAERPERNDRPFAGPFESVFSGTNLTATYDAPFGQVLYTGNLLDKQNHNLARQEGVLPNQLGNQEDQAWYTLLIGDVDGYTHELRFSSAGAGDSPWEWLGGVALMNWNQFMFQFTPNPGPADEGYYANPPDHPQDVPPEDQQSSFLWATVDSVGIEKSVFGEATRRLGDFWEVTLGARAFETELTAHAVLTGVQIVGLNSEPGNPYSDNHYVSKEDGINPKLALRYLHSRNLQVYALVAKGFQFGGFQINPKLGNIEQQAEARGYAFGPYNSSELWDYELGVRTEWLDRRLRFDLTAFYLDWTDLQLTIGIPVNPAPIPGGEVTGAPENVNLGVIVNVAAAHSEGLEAALQVVPFEGATFTSSAAWVSALTDAPFDEENPEGPIPVGTRLPGSSRFQIANVLAFEGALPYFNRWTGGFTLTHSHIGPYPNTLRPVRDVANFDTLDARVNLVQQGQAWIPEISLSVNNITDVRGVVAYGGDNNTVNNYLFIRPRTTILQLSWKY